MNFELGIDADDPFLQLLAAGEPVLESGEVVQLAAAGEPILESGEVVQLAAAGEPVLESGEVVQLAAAGEPVIDSGEVVLPPRFLPRSRSPPFSLPTKVIKKKRGRKPKSKCFHLPADIKLENYDNKIYQALEITENFLGLCKNCLKPFVAFKVRFEDSTWEGFQQNPEPMWIPAEHISKKLISDFVNQ
jgi:hypothetical protein